jgi:Protein of unknown function (DUF1501)
MTLPRRTFLQTTGLSLGGIALSELFAADTRTAPGAHASGSPGVLEKLHHRATAKRVIFLFMAGGPSQMDLFDYKPLLNKLHGQQLPESVRRGQRLTGMTGSQSSLPLVGSPFKFRQNGESGAWVSDQLPHTAKVVDELCFIKSMHTEAINHGPAVTHVQTGSQFPGRPSIGAWLSYGLGTENANLPAFVVMVTKNKSGQPLVSRLWGSGFLPSRHQGTQFRAGKDPVLYLSNPNGLDAASRRRQLDTLKKLYELKKGVRNRFREESPQQDAASGKRFLTPFLRSRIAQYELAFRMQMSIPEVIDFSKEPKHVLDSYGPDAKNPGTFAANCLLARRLAERGVRFIQLYHQGWDHHGGLPTALPRQCRETDQPAAALIRDLKQRGLLDDTLVIWGGEFGRTNYCQGKLSPNFGRDHHPRCFTYWLAGGGIKPGTSYGETDDYCYNIAKDPVHLHDLQATLLHVMGIDHERLTFKYQGRQFRLTDVEGKVVRPVLA